MGQVISFIFGCLSGRKNENPRPNHEDYSPLRSYYIDTFEDHDDHSKAAAAAQPSFHPHHHVVTISQQQQAAVSDPIAEVDLHQPLIAPNYSIVANSTAGFDFEGTYKELNVRSAAEVATSTKRKGKNKKKNEKNPKNEKEAVRKIGLHNSKHKILLVGEGDFSFSASLAVAFGNASNIVATSLNDKDFLLKNYSKAMSNIMELTNRGSSVIHCVNATKMEDHELLRGMKFDRIIFNFPHTGRSADNARGLSRSQTLVREFLRNAKKMIEEDGGEIHVTHKTSRAFIKWNIVELASMEGLCLIKEQSFHPGSYPGYEPKFGFKGDKNFECYPCKTYRFGLNCVEV